MSRKLVLLVLLALGISSIVATANIQTVEAIIWVEGHITSDTTWSPVDTYRVINNTYVDSGVVLTILSGVHVQFADMRQNNELHIRKIPQKLNHDRLF